MSTAETSAPISIRFDAATRSALEDLAKREERSVSALVRLAVRAYLQERTA